MRSLSQKKKNFNNNNLGEQTLGVLKARMLDRKWQDEFQNKPEYKMLAGMVLECATFCSQDLELGEFAAHDHAGRSICWLRDRINLSQSMANFKFVGPDNGKRYVIPDGNWDLKSELKRAITDLKMDEWGLDYDDFKPSPPNNRPNRVPDLE